MLLSCKGIRTQYRGRIMRRATNRWLTVFFLCLCTVTQVAAQAEMDEDIEWRHYGGDSFGSKYSPAAQIDAENVHRLDIAWTWTSPDDTLGAEIGQRPGFFKATPLMIDGVLYLSTSFNQVAAVSAETGKTIWVHDPEAYKKGRPANTGWQHRGVAYWENATNDDRRIFMATGTGELIALNAEDGSPVRTFGTNGVVDLQAGIIRNEDERRHIGYNAAPAVIYDTIVLGCTVFDRPTSIEFARCPVRGFNAKTGKLEWSFDTLAQSDDPGSETWADKSWRYSGGANAWATFSADPALGYIYVPTGTPHNDYYGGHRKGDNLYAESLLCIEAATGRLVWHFQAIHHGLWDYDFPAAPTLIDLEVDGKSIHAVAQVSKQGFTYVFDRLTGEPLWPIVEKTVPQSDVPGEQTSPTQPFPTKPPAFVRQGISEDDLIDFTEEIKAMALDAVKDFKMGPMFTPPMVAGDGGKQTVIQVPGAAGGANWGGGGVDPESGYLFVQASNLPTPASVARGKEDQADYLVQFSAFPVMPNGLPIIKPPYGTVTAIDLNRGAIAWQVPHGEGPTNHPAIKHLKLGPLGASSHSFLSSGGPLVTRTLLFVNQAQADLASFSISATERFLRAFDKSTGAVVWERRMKLAPFGTPMTYVHESRQYVVLAAGGAGEPSQLVAFALP